jgi:L-threonylcarbamoyladenylate synthase
MGPKLLDANPEAVVVAGVALRQGRVVALPTDTVYGLAVDPSRPQAVERLFGLKERPLEVALPLLIGSRQDVEDVAGRLEGAAAHLADRYWPGPLTLVVPRRDGFTVDLGGPPASRQTVGIRLPDHPLVRGLCQELGPLAVTSANLHREPPATTGRQVMEVFAESDPVAVVLDGVAAGGVPSTVVECLGPTIRCLREGAIPWDDVFEHR